MTTSNSELRERALAAQGWNEKDCMKIEQARDWLKRNVTAAEILRLLDENAELRNEIEGRAEVTRRHLAEIAEAHEHASDYMKMVEDLQTDNARLLKERDEARQWRDVFDKQASGLFMSCWQEHEANRQLKADNARLVKERDGMVQLMDNLFPHQKQLLAAQADNARLLKRIEALRATLNLLTTGNHQDDNWRTDWIKEQARKALTADDAMTEGRS